MTVTLPQLKLRSKAQDALTQNDVVMAYQLFHGRNPESAAAIEAKLKRGFGGMATACMASKEFQEKVVGPLRRGQFVQRRDYQRQPSAEQKAWLSAYVEFTEDAEKALNEAKDWTEYFRLLCTIGGIDVSFEGNNPDGSVEGDPSLSVGLGAPPDAKEPTDERNRILRSPEQSLAPANASAAGGVENNHSTSERQPLTDGMLSVHGRALLHLKLRRKAQHALTQNDVIMAYEFFHGRNPESAAVIEDKRKKGFGGMIADCTGSKEFQEAVVGPLRRGQFVRRGDYRRRPSAAQKTWLSTYVEFTEDAEKALNDVKDWTEYFRLLCTIGGIDVSFEGNNPDGSVEGDRSPSAGLAAPPARRNRPTRETGFCGRPNRFLRR